MASRWEAKQRDVEPVEPHAPHPVVPLAPADPRDSPHWQAKQAAAAAAESEWTEVGRFTVPPDIEVPQPVLDLVDDVSSMPDFTTMLENRMS